MKKLLLALALCLPLAAQPYRIQAYVGAPACPFGPEWGCDDNTDQSAWIFLYGANPGDHIKLSITVKTTDGVIHNMSMVVVAGADFALWVFYFPNTATFLDVTGELVNSPLGILRPRYR